MHDISPATKGSSEADILPKSGQLKETVFFKVLEKEVLPSPTEYK
jgi:hypothetical protein